MNLSDFALSYGITANDLASCLLERKTLLRSMDDQLRRELVSALRRDSDGPAEATGIDLVAEAELNLRRARELRDTVFKDGRIVGTVKDAQSVLQAVDRLVATATKHYQDMYGAASVMALESAVKEAMDELGPEAAKKFMAIFERKAREIRE